MHFSQCAQCHDILEITYAGQETHPGCNPTAAEILVRQFVDAIQRGDEGEARRLEPLVNRIDEPPALGSVALWYAEVAGWPVFPLRPGEKRPATKHGLLDATVDPDQIREWWSREPMANIGGPTGNTYDVVDVDGPQGIRSLAELGDEVLPEVHGKAATPRGFHYFVLSTGDGNRAGVRPGLDYRGRGGFVVLSPSVVGGKRYSWLMRPSPRIIGSKVSA